MVTEQKISLQTQIDRGTGDNSVNKQELKEQQHSNQRLNDENNLLRQRNDDLAN